MTDGPIVRASSRDDGADSALNARFDDGTNDRTAPFTWGQTAIWDVLSWLPPGDASLNQAIWLPAPPGRTLDEACQAIRDLMLRHESLRSTFVEDAVGRRQTIATRGLLRVPLRLSTTESLERDAAEVADELRAIPFDLGTELPMRAAVLAQRDAALAVAVAASHMAVDGSSLRIVRDDLRALLAGAELGPRSRQPLERAVFEQSDAGRDRERRTVSYWDRTLRALSPDTLRALDAAVPDRFEWARLRSAGTARAVHAVAARTSVSDLAALTTAVVVVLAALTDCSELAFRSIISTRFDERDRGLVGAFNLNALIPARIDGGTFDDFVREIGAATVRSLRYCEADPRSIDSTIAAVGDEGAFEPGDYCFLNDVRYHETDAPAQTDADLDDRPEIERFDSPNRQKGSKLFLYIRELSQRCVLVLCVDRRYLRTASADDFLHGVDWLLRYAAQPGAGSWPTGEVVQAVIRAAQAGWPIATG